jgi:hypothetical protein
MGLNGIYSTAVRREPKEKNSKRARLLFVRPSYVTAIPATQLISDMEPALGESHLLLHAQASVDCAACSPPKNSSPSNRWWPALSNPPAKRAPNPETLSTSATWCNSGQGPTRTGKRACFWSARSATTAVSRALCCVLIAVGRSLLGIRTAFPRFCASAERRFRPRNGQSTALATLHFVLDAWEGNRRTSWSEYYVNSNLLSRHNIAISALCRSP